MEELIQNGLRILVLLFLGNILVSCSTINIIDKQIQPTYNRFVGDYLLYIGNPPPEAIEIHLKDLDGEEGYYHKKEHKTYLDELTWVTASVHYKELLLYHEMGHHILRRLHNNLMFDDGCPVSIMYYQLHEGCYKKYKKYYVEELFSVSGEY